MDPFSIVGMIIVAIVVLAGVKILSKIAHVALYLLLMVLAIVFFFGVTFDDVFTFLERVLLLVL